MRRLLLAAFLAIAVPVAAQARPPMETNQIVDGDGVPLGTAANPLNVQGGAGGSASSGSVTAAGTPGTQAQAFQGIPGGIPAPVMQQDGFRPWGMTGGTASAVQVLGPGGTPAVIDTTGYGAVAIQNISFAVGGNVTVQRSLDGGATWNTVAVTSEANTGTSSDVTALNGSLMAFPAGGLVRFNQIAYTSGTTQIVPILLSRGTPVRSVFATLGPGTATIGGTLSASTFSEAFRTTLAANGAITGTARDLGAATGAYARFGATVVTDQAGTLQVQASTNATDWITVATQAATAGTPLDVSLPIRARYYRAVYTNGATATGATAFSLLTSFTAN